LPNTKPPQSTRKPKQPALVQRRRPTQARAHNTVEAVLRAAGAEIERAGLDKLTTKNIAAAAGLSVGGVYEYFPNKESILSALAAQWMERVLQAIDSVHPRHGGTRDLLNYLNEQMLLVARLYEDQPGLGALIDMLSAIPALRDLTQRHDTDVTASVASALSHYAPQASSARVADAARSISLICHAILSAALVHRSGDREQLMMNLRICLMAIASHLLLSD
jgi:AcrR family transcriptional regulator